METSALGSREQGLPGIWFGNSLSKSASFSLDTSTLAVPALIASTVYLNGSSVYSSPKIPCAHEAVARHQQKDNCFQQELLHQLQSATES